MFQIKFDDGFYRIPDKCLISFTSNQVEVKYIKGSNVCHQTTLLNGQSWYFFIESWKQQLCLLGCQVTKIEEGVDWVKYNLHPIEPT